MHIRPICLGFIAAGWVASARQCIPASQSLSSTAAASSSSSSGSVAYSTETTADSPSSATTVSITSITANPTSSISSSDISTESSSDSTTTSIENVGSTTSEVTTESTTSVIVDTTTSITLAPTTTPDSTTSTPSTLSFTSTSAVPTLSTFSLTSSSPANLAASGKLLTSWTSKEFLFFSPTDPNYQVHPFYLEDGTNKLMTNNMYVIWYGFNREIFVIAPSDLPSAVGVSKFTCDGARVGQPLSCSMDLHPTLSQFLIDPDAATDVAMWIPLDTDFVQPGSAVPVDLIVGEV